MYCPNGLLCWKRVCLCVARYMCNSSIPIWYLLNIFIVASGIVCYSIRWQCHGDLRSQPHPCIPIGLVSYFVCFASIGPLAIPRTQAQGWLWPRTRSRLLSLMNVSSSSDGVSSYLCACFFLCQCVPWHSWIVSQIEWVLKQRFGIRANWYYHFDWSNSRMSMEMMLLCSTISFSNAGCAVHVCAECASW